MPKKDKFESFGLTELLKLNEKNNEAMLYVYPLEKFSGGSNHPEITC